MAFRRDIQALRGVAVLLVLFQHAGIGPFRAGYLGVDIFFVISGYLITRMIGGEIETGTFTFASFYVRRAKRLLPSAYVTLAVTLLVAPFILDGFELEQFRQQVLGALTFTANIVLFNQTDYFQSSAALKPLLHVWSLAIEEQYYMFLPLVMTLVPVRQWRKAACTITLLSLGLCIALLPRHPVATFYWLPMRAWELGVGSLSALFSFDGLRAKRTLRWAFFPALSTLAVLPMMPLSSAHPGIDAMLICVATAVVILHNSTRIADIWPTKALAKVGDVSYSLYLVHWPMMAFLNNAYMGTPSLESRAAALVLSIVLAGGLYRLVERPCRHMALHLGRRPVLTVLGASLALALMPYAVTAASASSVNYEEVRRINFGFNAACEYEGTFAPKPECRNSDHPTVMVWGDSFAMHLIPGISATLPQGVIQATQSMCGPMLHTAPIAQAPYNRTWAEGCLAFNRSVFDYLRATPTIEVVVLSSVFGQYFDPPRGGIDRRLVREVSGRLTEVPTGIEMAVTALAETIQELHVLGKRVALVAPPPTAGFDIGRCLERRAKGKLVLGVRSDCRIDVSDYRKEQSRLFTFLEHVEKESGAHVISFDDVLCSREDCTTQIGSVFVYRDGGHLSNAGSVLVGQRMQIGNEILRHAN